MIHGRSTLKFSAIPVVIIATGVITCYGYGMLWLYPNLLGFTIMVLQSQLHHCQDTQNCLNVGKQIPAPWSICGWILLEVRYGTTKNSRGWVFCPLDMAIATHQSIPISSTRGLVRIRKQQDLCVNLPSNWTFTQTQNCTLHVWVCSMHHIVANLGMFINLIAKPLKKW